MAIFKCKMCGGQLDINDETVVECEYCGTKQTVPTLDNEKKVSLFTRANKLRTACDFDKAYSVYESIVAEFDEEAEAYWGLVLCKYGIEYVDDPATGKKVPTCHRTSFDSVMDDSNFEMVMENADSVAVRVYREEAKTIESIRKGIIEVSSKEEPYDIFICYKETDEDGERTLDSVLAQDIYTELTDKGYRVFFSRITLEDKLGQEYEPYIFSALNSAKVMLVVGTDYIHFNAVWVKNEWSRFLKLIANGEKKTLIPCYKDIDAYDMPKEFNKLQAQDLGKVGATQDLLRGIEKIIPLKREEDKKSVTKTSSNPTFNSLLKRAFNFLEDENWEKADEYFERVLDIDPDNAQAYVGKLLVDYGVHNLDELVYCGDDLSEHYQYVKAMRYADKNLKKKLTDINSSILAFIDSKKYDEATEKMFEAKTEEEFITVANLFNKISGYKDASSLANQCLNTANKMKLDKENEQNRIKSLINEYKSLYVNNKNGTRIQEVKSLLYEHKIGKQFINSYDYVNGNIGETVLFGEYEQSSNRKDKIEWVILDKENNKVLLISKKILECIKFNNEAKGSIETTWKYSWKNSDIRKWLNDDFFNNAFSDDEKELILESINENNYSDIEGLDKFIPSEYVMDYIFCLSKKEVLKYFKSDDDRKCDPTQLAKNHGAKPPMFNTSCSWWLRAPVERSMGLLGDTVVYSVKLVGYKGTISSIGLPIDNNYSGVRPCLWLGVDMDDLNK